MEIARIRLFFLCVCLSIFGVVPNESENYFPNNAYKAMQGFLNATIKNTTGEELNENTMGITWSIFVTMDIVGVVIGSMFVPAVSSHFGRSRSSLVGAVFLTIPGRVLQLLSTISPLWPLLFVGKFMASASIAIIEPMLAVLVSEVAPAEIRGRLAILLPMGICEGAILGTTLGLSSVLGTPERWHYAYYVFLGLLLPSLPLLFFLPESPTLLLYRNLDRKDPKIEAKAAASLAFYQGGGASLENARKDAKLLSASAQKEGLGAWLEVIRSPSLRRQLKLAFVVCSLYFPVVIIQSYSTLMLHRVGVSEDAAEMATIGLKLLSFAEFLLCIMISDRVPRRTQLFFGTAVSAVAFLLLAASQGAYSLGGQQEWGWAFAASLYLLQAGLNVGIRPLYWVIVPEIFPFRHRAAGKALINATSACEVILLNILFYELLVWIGFWVYALCAAPILLGLFYCVRNFPETGGRELHQIFAEFERLDAGELK